MAEDMAFNGLSDIKDAISRTAQAYEQMKTYNDERYKALEDGNTARAAELQERIDKAHSDVEKYHELQKTQHLENEMLKERVEELESRQMQPGATKREKYDKMYLEAWEASFRKGFNDQELNRRMNEVRVEAQKEVKDITIGTDIGGGHALPEEIGRQIEFLEMKFSPVRRLVKVVRSSTNDYKELVTIHGGTSGWVAETGTRSATGTPNLRQVTPTMGELYALPRTTEWALDDLFMDVTSWLTEDVARDFAQAEGTAVISGDGSDKPTGMTNTTPVTTNDDASPLRAAAAYEYLGVTGAASPVVLTANTLIDCVYLLNSAYRVNATWVMNSTTTATVRSLKVDPATAASAYVWEPNFQVGEPARILGYPVETWEQMPAIADDNFPIAFGDFRRGYLLVDRVGLRISNDSGIATPGYVRFYVRRREGGIPLNNDAIKFIRIAD